MFNSSDMGQNFNFDEYNSTSMNGIDKHIIYYDWLADSGTTLHVSNKCEAFKTYTPLKATTVAGVGNVKAKVEGRGTVELELHCNSHKYILWLENVLYIPTNHNNLISLGHWNNASRKYIGKGGGAYIHHKGW